MTIPLSVEVREIFAEGRDVAQRSGREFDTSFLLLALFLVPNRAVAVFQERGVSEDRLLSAFPKLETYREERLVLQEIEVRMNQIAQGAGGNVVNTIHLLVALSRVRKSKAYRILQSAQLEPAEIRREALALLMRPGLLSTHQNKRLRPGGAATQVMEAEVRPLPVRERPPVREETAFEEMEAEETPAPLPMPEEDSEREEDGVETPYSLIPELYPTLVSLGRNLTEEAYLGKIDPVVGREQEIEQVMDILQKRRSNNPCLIGEPGVGKTAIVEGVARLLVSPEGGGSPRILVELNTAGLIAGTHLRGAFAERLAAVKEEVKRADGSIIIFIDEIHTLMGAGAGDGPLDASNDLKAALARGEFPCIGATTLREYKKYVEADSAMDRRFQPVSVIEPSPRDAEHILRSIAPKYEEHHGVQLERGVVEEIVRLSARYIPERQLPDKAINILDLACARVSRKEEGSVDAMDVVDVVAQQTGIPAEKLTMTDSERLLQLGSFLKKRVLGQDVAMDSIAEVICRNFAGFNSNRPMGSILMVGPTGVGKTETVKVLASFLFHSKDAIVRFDMSEFSEPHSVSKLIGAPPGYSAHEEGGLLTEAVYKKPYQVILFDEVEKAAPEVWNLLLQVLDEGRLTDARGKTVSFSNTVVMATSNLGAEEFENGRRNPIGFGARGKGPRPHSGVEEKSSEADRVLKTVKEELPLELWNRIEEKLVFHPLSKEQVGDIARLLVRESSERLSSDRGIEYEVTTAVIEHLVERGGYDASLGARPMRQLVQRLVEGAIASAILRGAVHQGEKVQVDLEAGELVVRVLEARLSVVS